MTAETIAYLQAIIRREKPGSARRVWAEAQLAARPQSVPQSAGLRPPAQGKRHATAH